MGSDRGSRRPAGCRQELAEIAVSGDDHQGAGGGIVEDGPVGCREQPYVADMDGLQSGFAQGGGDFRRQVGVDEETHAGYAEWASGSSRSCTAAAANSRAARTSARSR